MSLIFTFISHYVPRVRPWAYRLHAFLSVLPVAINTEVCAPDNNTQYSKSTNARFGLVSVLYTTRTTEISAVQFFVWTMHKKIVVLFSLNLFSDVFLKNKPYTRLTLICLKGTKWAIETISFNYIRLDNIFICQSWWYGSWRQNIKALLNILCKQRLVNLNPKLFISGKNE